METKGLTCKIPLDLHNRITAEIRQNESTMSKFIEQIILEHYTKGATTMGKTRTLAFQVSEELFQQIKDYLTRYEQVYPSGGDQDIKGLLLQWDIAQCMIHSGVSRYNEELTPDWQAREELRAELAEHLTIQKGPADINLKEALPQLWQKRTEWEEAHAVQRPHPHRGWER